MKESYWREFQVGYGMARFVLGKDYSGFTVKKGVEQPWRMNLWLLGEGTVREFGIVYTVMRLKQIIPRTYCVAQGTLLNVRCQPGWEGSLGTHREPLSINGFHHLRAVFFFFLAKG